MALFQAELAHLYQVRRASNAAKRHIFGPSKLPAVLEEEDTMAEGEPADADVALALPGGNVNSAKTVGEDGKGREQGSEQRREAVVLYSDDPDWIAFRRWKEEREKEKMEQGMEQEKEKEKMEQGAKGGTGVGGSKGQGGGRDLT